MTTPRLQLTGITKRYPGVVANNDVSLVVLPGEIHALLGENGAGKSTLVKIIYGSVKPDVGEVNFNGTAVNIAFKVLGADHDGSALLALVGTSGLTLTMAGGISDAPTKDEYLGVEASKTGVYAIDDMPVTSRPNKFWCPDSPIAVDDSGVDSTLAIDTAMIAYAEARLATAKQLVYLFSAEYGLIPTTLLTAIASDGIDSTRAAEYWPWVRLSDPVSGSYKWVPVTGHMILSLIHISEPTRPY